MLAAISSFDVATAAPGRQRGEMLRLEQSDNGPEFREEVPRKANISYK